ncbi:UNKNOWN [Stylonychia lemnae]|uniref:Transmembrane protein n=1 Tax=Stylonychia lemnae TaxID=5949 RepID=A0A078BAP1_STYLE|nr:UNKNOWN [Stylonychia lemnae]|eukprot:CDW91635.1 UNKNOWN [Stylonychia lemnae]
MTRKDEQKTKIFTKEDNDKEYLVRAWRELNPQIVETEIKHAMIRNEIENLSFGNLFLSRTRGYYQQSLLDFDYYKKNKYDPKQIKKVLREANQLLAKQDVKNQRVQGALNDNFKKKFSSVRPMETTSFSQNKNRSSIQNIQYEDSLEELDDEKLLLRYPARLYCREGFLTAQIVLPPKQKCLGAILSLIHGALSFSMILYSDYQNDQKKEIWYERYTYLDFWLYTISLFYINSFIFYANSAFFDIAIIDYSRKYMLNIAMSVVIEANRQKMISVLRTYPLMNIFDRQTMICVLYLGYFFGLNVKILDNQQWVIIIFEIIIILILTLIIMNLGVRINSEAENQIFKMTELKNQLDRIYSDWDQIMKNRKSVKSIINNNYKLAQNYYTTLLKIKSPKQCKKDLLSTIKVIDSIRERLEKEHEYNPMKLLGIPLRYSFLYTVYTGLLSLVFAMVQKKTNLFS